MPESNALDKARARIQAWIEMYEKNRGPWGGRLAVSFPEHADLNLSDIQALLAATAPPTDDEREAILNPFDRGTDAQERLVLEAAKKWATRRRGPITDEARNRAERAVYAELRPLRGRLDWAEDDTSIGAHASRIADAALEAARAAE